MFERLVVQEMVNFLDPANYLYGTECFDGAAEQGGVYNRYCNFLFHTFSKQRLMSLS